MLQGYLGFNACSLSVYDVVHLKASQKSNGSDSSPSVTVDIAECTIELRVRDMPPVYGYGSSDCWRDVPDGQPPFGQRGQHITGPVARPEEANRAKWAVDAAIRDAFSQLRLVLMRALPGEDAAFQAHAVVVDQRPPPWEVEAAAAALAAAEYEEAEHDPNLPQSTLVFAEIEEDDLGLQMGEDPGVESQPDATLIPEIA